MNDERLQTVEQVKQFLAGSEALDFGGVSVEERCQWIQTVLVRFKYYQLKRAEKGVILHYIKSERLWAKILDNIIVNPKWADDGESSVGVMH
jgi:hypothetical protein